MKPPSMPSHADCSHCPIHPETRLQCPRCLAQRGGRATAKKYGTAQLSAWGKAGGSARHKKKAKAAKPALAKKNRKK